MTRSRYHTLESHNILFTHITSFIHSYKAATIGTSHTPIMLPPNHCLTKRANLKTKQVHLFCLQSEENSESHNSYILKSISFILFAKHDQMNHWVYKVRFSKYINKHLENNSVSSQNKGCTQKLQKTGL